MATPRALRCIRCAKRFPLSAGARGCAACEAQGVGANLTVDYDERAALGRDAIPAAPRSMWRYEALLPAAADEAVTLGEGATPLVDASKLGLGALYLKDESRNPTWSFKDRLASASVTMAKKLGARVIASSSSGNAGAATAAYAARAGLPCVVLTYRGAAGPMVTQMRAYGALLLEVPTPEDRWRVLSSAVAKYGWWPTSVYYGPAVGSNPWGIEGYKTIAYEIAESLGWRAPDWCAIPVCYGDSLYGMWRGFEEMRALGWIDRVPRFVAAEVTGSLAQALRDGVDQPPALPDQADTLAGSIRTVQATHQSVAALRAAGGHALRIADADMLAWQQTLARTLGVWAEPAAAAPLPAIARLRAEGMIGEHDTVVSLLTAGGLKDPHSTDRRLAPAPFVVGDADDALRALKEAYGFEPH